MSFIETGFKGKNKWWMYILTFSFVFVGSQLGGIPLILVAISKTNGNLSVLQESGDVAFSNLGINSNLLLFLNIVVFIVALFVLLGCLKFIHKKQLKWIVTSREQIDWQRILFGFVFWAIVSSVCIGISILIAPELYSWNFKPIPFLLLLTISLFFLPFQTSTEELLFRGYLMQGVGLIAKNKWVPLFVTSVIFGLLHLANPEIEKIGYIALIYYIGTGFFFGIITLMDEGTELVLGLHAANNVVAAFFVTANWTVFQTEALFIDIAEPAIFYELFIPICILYPLTLLFFSRKYRWADWRVKLMGTLKATISNEK